ncbi:MULTISPECIES: glycosyltransferase [unclassified Ornithinimicrobium]|uniref:glycosyltransferase n=1 Tax=unclassified Ornithinimicrobium TaxID=2615080 RepID=UPI003852B952
MRVLALSSPIYAHTLNAAPFLEGLAAHGAEVHWGVASTWAGHDGGATAGPAPAATLWDTGPVVPFVPPGGRVRDVSARYAWLLEDTSTRVAATREILDQVRPDVVLTDSLGYAAALAAEQRGLPWVSFGDGPLHFPDARTPPFGAGLPYRTPAPWVWRNHVVQLASRRVVMREAQRRYAALRAELGLPRRDVPVLEACLSPVLHLHCGAPELEYPRADLPDHVHFVGALRPPVATDWQPPSWWSSVVEEHGGDVVLATQGTLRGDPGEVLRPTLEALRAAGRPGVLTTGSGDPGALGGPGLVGDGAGGAGIAVESFVPYERVLPHAGVFVTNGGWTGVLLALAHGVPVLQVGRTEEKADIGRRVEWAGAGIHLGAALPSQRQLRRALERVEGAAYRAGARRIADSLATRDPGRDGAALVARLLSGREPGSG